MSDEAGSAGGARGIPYGELVAQSRSWIHQALRASTERDFGRVAVMAPLAVELIGKAALFRRNPVLVAAPSDETSLLLLAGGAGFDAPGLRTAGLQLVLSRLTAFAKDMPVSSTHRRRMVEVRNGATHVGSSELAEHVLEDCLAVIQHCLDQLRMPSIDYFRNDLQLVVALLNRQARTVAGQVQIKLERARARLVELEQTVGTDSFPEVARSIESQRWTTTWDDVLDFAGSHDWNCPVCDSSGRLWGEVEAQTDVDWDVERDADGGYFSVPAGSWQLTLVPEEFRCGVCHLRLSGGPEIKAAGLPPQISDVTDERIIDPDYVAVRDN